MSTLCKQHIKYPYNKKKEKFRVPKTVGSPFMYVNIYLFKNKVHPLKKYHSVRKNKALILSNPCLELSDMLITSE